LVNLRVGLGQLRRAGVLRVGEATSCSEDALVFKSSTSDSHAMSSSAFPSALVGMGMLEDGTAFPGAGAFAVFRVVLVIVFVCSN